jgi:sialic acid synthase SpsE
VAASSGASACKFQTYSSETLYSKNTPNFAGHKDVNKLIKEIELPREWQKELKDYCDIKGIEFMSTPFDEKAVEELVNIGVKRLKISGFESTDFRFIEMVASSKLPLIISLGIGFQMNFIDKIFDIAQKYDNELSFLHCNNAYPTPIEDAGISIIKELCLNKQYKWGLSDHTESPLTPALAVAVGAQIIEKHFTLSKLLSGPDHSFALEPDELKEMIDNIIFAEKSIEKKSSEGISKSEKKCAQAMRSVVTSQPIKKGEKFTTKNLTTKRPCLEAYIPAFKFDFTLDFIATRDYDIDEHILKKDIKLL